MSLFKKWGVALVIVLCGVAGLIAKAYAARSSSPGKSMTVVQDVRSLDRRISSLELRLYSIETSINRLEQSSISPRTSVPNTSAPEINQLRAEIQTMQLRLNEIECGLVKLDERTMNAAVREARKDAAARIADPCRVNPTTPLRLSTRP
jgi:predicted  nucleic acid-binding Zn-ribbon protein